MSLTDTNAMENPTHIVAVTESFPGMSQDFSDTLAWQSTALLKIRGQ
jgi:hypothetical protein